MKVKYHFILLKLMQGWSRDFAPSSQKQSDNNLFYETLVSQGRLETVRPDCPAFLKALVTNFVTKWASVLAT